VRAVDGVSFTINRGEFYGLVGESGCGKSTVARLVSRLMKPTRGKIFFQGTDITEMKGRMFSSIRRQIQMVFQDPFGSFNPKMRMREALSEIGKYYGINRKESADRILMLLSYVGLSEDVLSRFPREFSGGQLQRLAVVRALMTDPMFVVADEPVSSLDVSVQAQLLNLLCDLRSRLSLTMLFISHDIAVVEYLCDRVGVMYLGKLVEEIPSGELFTEALHPYTRMLLDAEADCIRISKNTAEKEPTNPLKLPEGCLFQARCRSSVDRCRSERPLMTRVSAAHYVSCHYV
jgi:oligopeptide/dipeptide ABC transporter ATP-binding protein